MTTIAITETAKGARIWIQGLEGKGIQGSHFRVHIGDATIGIAFTSAPEGKGWRKVTRSKGGIVDLQSNKVTRWARGATQATITVDTQTQTVTLERAN